MGERFDLEAQIKREAVTAFPGKHENKTGFLMDKAGRKVMLLFSF